MPAPLRVPAIALIAISLSAWTNGAASGGSSPTGAVSAIATAIEAVAAGGRISREEAERLLGGGSTLTAVAADDDVLPDDEGGSEE